MRQTRPGSPTVAAFPLRPVAVVAVLLVAVALPASAQSVVDVLEQQQALQERLLGRLLTALETANADLLQSFSRVERLTEDLIRAQQAGETLESFELRDDDLRTAEAELMLRTLEAQQLRREVAASRALIEELTEQLQRLREQGGVADPVTGRWAVAQEPGGQTGFWDLALEGAIVSGTYRLSGGWTGSLRGTLVGGRLRLERIDSEAGFVAIYHGRIWLDEEPARMQGRWESTELGQGDASAGGWVARKVEEIDGEE